MEDLEKILETLYMHFLLISKTSFEELSNNPMECMKEIYTKLDIGTFSDVNDTFESYLNKQKNYKKNAFKPLDPIIKKQINNRWKFAFEAWDYQMN